MVARARQLRFNRLLPKKVEASIDPAGQHILTDSFAHGDAECIRCLVMVKIKNKDDPVQGQLDFCMTDFLALPDQKPDENAVGK